MRLQSRCKTPSKMKPRPGKKENTGSWGKRQMQRASAPGAFERVSQAVAFDFLVC